MSCSWGHFLCERVLHFHCSNATRCSKAPPLARVTDRARGAGASGVAAVAGGALPRRAAQAAVLALAIIRAPRPRARRRIVCCRASQCGPSLGRAAVRAECVRPCASPWWSSPPSPRNAARLWGGGRMHARAERLSTGASRGGVCGAC